MSRCALGVRARTRQFGMTCSSVLSSRGGYRTSSGSTNHLDQLAFRLPERFRSQGHMSELTRTATTASGLPSVSVVVPVRNERQRISDLLAAIEAQTLRPIEVLVADGCSDDGTLEWLRAAAQRRPSPRVVENPDRVIPNGLNLAIALARGEVVARMDAHAYYAPDYLRQLANVLAGHAEVVGVGGAMTTDGTIWLEPQARVTWYTRESVKALACQMWRYGFFKARTLRLHPRSVRPRQLAPPALVLCLTAVTIGRPRLGMVSWLCYLGTAIGLGASAGRSDRVSAWRAGLATPTVHLCCGLGLLVGLLRHRETALQRRPFLPEPATAIDEPVG